MNLIHHELNLGGVYVPPLFLAVIIGTMMAIYVAKLLNHYRLSNYLFYPPLVFLAMATIFTVLVDYILGIF
jgi:hypothetical protein